MTFKASVEKLNKGWLVTVPVKDFESAQAIIEEAQAVASTEARRFQATMRRRTDGAYSVGIYKSTLKEAQAFILAEFKEFQSVRRVGGEAV